MHIVGNIYQKLTKQLRISNMLLIQNEANIVITNSVLFANILSASLFSFFTIFTCKEHPSVT